jgi:hypothetical protein
MDKEFQKVNIRFPIDVYRFLKQEQKDKPHLTLNSIVVESVIKAIRGKHEA